MMRIIHITRWALISVMTSVLLIIDSAHGLTSCQTENPVSSWHECTGTMKNPDGSTYEGDWFDGRPHGQGILSSADGSAYVGEFRSGIRVGLGAMAYASGDRYAGYWKNGKADGYGIMRLATRSLYLGQWQDDQFHGQGLMLFKKRGPAMKYTSSEMMFAIWEDGAFLDLMPLFERANGWVLAGEADKLKTGPAIAYTRFAKYTGLGIAFLPNKWAYAGEFKVGEYHGKGAKLDKTKLIVGDWKSDRLVGPAAAISASGAVIFGDLNGLVIARQNDGDAYRGSFENIPQSFLYVDSSQKFRSYLNNIISYRHKRLRRISKESEKSVGINSDNESESTESAQNPELVTQPNNAAEGNEIIPDAEQSLLASDSVDNAPNQPLSVDLPEPEKIRPVREKKSNSDELKWGLDALDGRQIICEASDEPIFPTIGVQGFRFVGEKVREDIFSVDRGNVIIKAHGSGRVKKVGLKKVKFLGNNEILWELDRETLALKAGDVTEQSNIMQCEVPENLKDYDAKMEQHRLKSLDTLKAEIKKNKI